MGYRSHPVHPPTGGGGGLATSGASVDEFVAVTEMWAVQGGSRGSAGGGVV